jgi:hypothetical protein
MEINNQNSLSQVVKSACFDRGIFYFCILMIVEKGVFYVCCCYFEAFLETKGGFIDLL